MEQFQRALLKENKFKAYCNIYCMSLAFPALSSIMQFTFCIVQSKSWFKQFNIYIVF